RQFQPIIFVSSTTFWQIILAKQMLGQSNHQPKQQPPYTKARLFKEMAQVLKRQLENFHANELDEMQQAWDKYGPFEPPLVHIALAKAILDKKTNQHISFYLQYIVNTHIEQKNKNCKGESR
ncbi:MAG: hypothetical protein ACE5D6_05520, partial [Candidatus Zixiibacteriota bacterium]